VSRHGRTNQLLSPIRIIVRMPEPENLKVEDLSKSVKQAPHSQQAIGYRMHYTEILFTPSCRKLVVQGPGSFPGLVNFSVRRRVAELRGIKLAQFSDFGLCWRYMHSTGVAFESLTRMPRSLSHILVGAYTRQMVTKTQLFHIYSIVSIGAVPITLTW